MPVSLEEDDAVANSADRPPFPASDARPGPTEVELLAALNARADAVVDEILGAPVDGPGQVRSDARTLRRLAASFVSDRSRHHHGAGLLQPIGTLLDRISSAQHADGTFVLGNLANLHSPPDSAFVVEELGLVWALLRRDTDAADSGWVDRLAQIIGRVGPALATGGVHTPNHRWAVCAALAWIDQVRSDPAYRTRIDQWLGEGIDQDADGHYSERSPNYAARVTNPALLTLARFLDRPELREPVRRNLALTLHCLDPDGAVEAIQSRRQDQDVRTVDLADFYPQLRELALADGELTFAAAARWAEQRGLVSSDVLAELLERPELAAPLPEGGALPDRFAIVYDATGLVRLRRDDTTVTVFGGTDAYDSGEPDEATRATRIGSGLSTNPTFLRVCRGEAVLESVRMSSTFFGLGHFRGDGVRELGPGRFALSDELRAAYYQPLASPDRRDDGAYRHEFDGRFFASMAFSRRPRTYRTLRRQVVVADVTDGVEAGQARERLALEVAFDVAGEDGVAVTVELCFRAGGVLTGVQPVGDAFVLTAGTGSYAVGEDRIEFGPGSGTGAVDPDPGEQYRTHQGSRTPRGQLVYLTGTTPFRHVLRIGCS